MGRLCQFVIDGYMEKLPLFRLPQQVIGKSPQRFLRSEVDQACYSSMCPYLALLADKFCGIMALLAVTRLFLVSSWPRQRRVSCLVILVQPLATAALGALIRFCVKTGWHWQLLQASVNFDNHGVLNFGTCTDFNL